MASISQAGAAGNGGLISRSVYSRAWASSLRYRDFRLFWASTLFYSLGTGMGHVAVGWLVFDITGSAVNPLPPSMLARALEPTQSTLESLKPQ